ncbi:GNAT family N-acetyltransferase [Actinopolymorpha singaporensis]
MSETGGNVSVRMVRDDFADVPQHELPAGYRFRTYEAGDDRTWTDLHLAAEPYVDVTPDLFVREFGTDHAPLSDRMFFVETLEGEPAGSITAWWERDRHNPRERGRIHWVVVHPDHQRRGLAKPMMTHAMQRLAQSHPGAVLGTSTGRTWALKVYLDFGFHPDPDELASSPEVAAGWRGVQSRLNHPLLASHLR